MSVKQENFVDTTREQNFIVTPPSSQQLQLQGVREKN